MLYMAGVHTNVVQFVSEEFWAVWQDDVNYIKGMVAFINDPRVTQWPHPRSVCYSAWMAYVQRFTTRWGKSKVPSDITRSFNEIRREVNALYS